MKTWRIPVLWEMEGVVEVVADTLKEAVLLATQNVMPLPDNGKRLYDFFRTGDDIYYIRKEYNNGQEDETPVKEDPKIAHWRPLKVYPDEATCSNCGELRPDGGADICPGCGYNMTN